MDVQATKAIFRHGDPVMIDYTADADVAAGDVISLGNTTGLSCGIAHVDIANGEKGALAAGGGVYEVIMVGNYANYVNTVYWDDDGKVNTTSTNNEKFGQIVSGGGGGANAAVYVLHDPQV